MSYIFKRCSLPQKLNLELRKSRARFLTQDVLNINCTTARQLIPMRQKILMSLKQRPVYRSPLIRITLRLPCLQLRNLNQRSILRKPCTIQNPTLFIRLYPTKTHGQQTATSRPIKHLKQFNFQLRYPQYPFDYPFRLSPLS